MARVWPWLRMLVAVGILVVLAWRVGTDAFLDAVRVLDATTVFVALAAGLLTTVVSAGRWCVVARGLGLSLPMSTAVADYYHAQFLNTALPGGVLGDVHRAVRHGRAAGDLGRGVRAVVLERAAGQVVLLGVGVPVVLAAPLLAPLRDVALMAGVAVVAACALVAGLVWAVPRVGGRSGWHRRVATWLTDARVGLASGTTPVVVVALSVVAVVGHLGLFVVAARAAGVHVPLVQVVPLVLVALLAMGLPVNIGGWGPREGMAVLAFAAAGLGAEQGLTTAVVYGVLTVVSGLPGAGVLLLRRSGGTQVELEQRVLAEREAAGRSA